MKIHARIQTSFKNIQSERSRDEVPQTVWFQIHMKLYKTGKPTEVESILMVPNGWEEGEIESDPLMGAGFLLGWWWKHSGNKK